MARMSAKDTPDVLSETPQPDGSVRVIVRFWEKRPRVLRTGMKLPPSVDRIFIFDAQACAMYLNFHEVLEKSLNAISGRFGSNINREPLPRTTPGLGIFVWLYMKRLKKLDLKLPAGEIVIDAILMTELFRTGQLKRFY